MLAAIIVLVIKIIWNWSDTSSLLGRLLSVITPFVMGLFIAYLINPLVEFLNRKLFRGIFRIRSKKISRGLSILLSYAFVITLITTCMFYIIPQIAESLTQLRHLISSAQTGYNKIIEFVENLNNDYPEWKLEVVTDFIDDIPKVIEKYIGDIMLTVLPAIYTTSISVIFGILDMIIAIIVSVYMLFDKSKLINNCKIRILLEVIKQIPDSTILKSSSLIGQYIFGDVFQELIKNII